MLTFAKQFIKNLKYFSGVIHGSKAFIGPYHLQIMLTNKCKTRCVYCVHRSPLRKKSKPKSWMEQELDFNRVKEIIDDAKKIGVEEIILTGGGEPLLYPKIYDVIKHIKKKKLKCTLITNGIHINKKNAKRLVKLKVDRILLNIFSGGTENNITRTIQKKVGLLSYFKKLKEYQKSKRPYISLVGIISKMNYGFINEIFNLGKNTGVNEVFLKPTRLIKDTRSLLLTKEQRNLVYKNMLDLKRDVKIKNNINDFIKQIMHKSYLNGRTDRELPQRAPCYIGWISTEILANGDVIPCCASYNQVIGNINQKRLAEIWYSKEYNIFRKSSKKVIKDELLKSACIPNINPETLGANCVLYDYNIHVHKILRPFDYIKMLKEESKTIKRT